ncbi:MAG: hypothetical protein RBS07_01830 [Lentimicrobium sp.]|jgi:hypothetical protein|nr:hypothetical protein [Lentimicrobium sp.]
MNEKFNTYLKKILILTAVIAIIMIVSFLIIPERVSIALPFLLAFFLGISIISYMILQKKAVENPRKFITGFLAHTGIRMMIYLAIIVTYALLNRDDAVNFIIGFFILYIFFTFFEVMQFIALTKKNQ